MNTPQRFLTLCLAVFVAVAFGQTAADAKGLPPKQKFEVTYEAEWNSVWIASGDHNTNWDFADQCVVGIDGRGRSQFGAQTKKTVVSLPADAKKGTIYGQVPIRAWVVRGFSIGERPPEGCGYDDYDELSQRVDCSNAPQWDHWEGEGWDNPPAYLNVIAGKGVVNTDVRREREKEHLATQLPYCPFLGTKEGDVGGTAKLSTKKLFSGKPVTVTGKAEHYQSSVSTHRASGDSKYKLTIRYLGKRAK